MISWFSVFAFQFNQLAPLHRVRITNESDKIVQLRDRRWEITNGDGHKEVVSGPGVIGQQPVLMPGQTFEYASACPLATSRGVMQGAYTFRWMLTDDEVEGADVTEEQEAFAMAVIAAGGEFDVEVGAFGLDAELG